jgi:hypothetical protein
MFAHDAFTGHHGWIFEYIALSPEAPRLSPSCLFMILFSVYKKTTSALFGNRSAHPSLELLYFRYLCEDKIQGPQTAKIINLGLYSQTSNP